MPPIRTRLLIISDTHDLQFAPGNHPKQRADVVIHCGDLTAGSRLAEFRATLDLLRGLEAPLKLVIAGNHDFTMDIAMFKNKVLEAGLNCEPESVEEHYGSYGEAEALFRAASADGIVFLDEGTHRFVLDNGAALKVFASPFTPSIGDWGFQFHPNARHEFSIEEGTDIAITHGPPRGIMDVTRSRERAGSQHLFAAVARSRPRVHCFGHIHEGWGARLVAWRDDGTADAPSHMTSIDRERSAVVGNLQTLTRPADGCCRTSHCEGDARPIEPGRHTLFVNAAIQTNDEADDKDGTLSQPAWLVDIELASPSEGL